ncbi:MAG: RelA/SpoT domain-containing protein [Sphingorhabdus sp.]
MSLIKMQNRKSPSFVRPGNSKGRVNRSGTAISLGNQTAEDMAVVENWRTSHAYLLNTFQATLRNKAKGKPIIVAQRLKRRPTILGKLQRYPQMKLARMHDIAGCRVIFDSVAALEDYRAKMHKARFKHIRKAEEQDRWNYLRSPKPSGYRGVHDVYEYRAKVGGGEPWNGLLLEIQYRTQVQHAWATAVEVAGLVTHNNPKFDQGSSEVLEFFKLSSEILARAYENSTSCYPGLTNSEVITRLDEANRKTHMLRLFKQIRIVQGQKEVQRKNTIMVLKPAISNGIEEIQLDIYTFNNIFSATEEYHKLEQDLGEKADVVLVKSDSMDSIQAAYQNYFGDTSEFTSLLADGQKTLKRSL